jgi:hypothetical protein
MSDFSHFRLTDSSEILLYQELFSQQSTLLNKWWLWLINRPPGSVFDIKKIPESHREMFIKLACIFIMDKHPWICFNETFTELRCESMPFAFDNEKYFRAQILTRIKENVLMNENRLIESPTGSWIRVGKVVNGCLNIMTSFNPIEQCLQPMLKRLSGVKRVTGIYAYPDNSGGIAIEIDETFRPSTFTDQLTEILTSIDKIVEMV